MTFSKSIFDELPLCYENKNNYNPADFFRKNLETHFLFRPVINRWRFCNSFIFK